MRFMDVDLLKFRRSFARCHALRDNWVSGCHHKPVTVTQCMWATNT